MRIIRYHSTVRGEAPSAALAAQKKSVAAPNPIARIAPKNQAQSPTGQKNQAHKVGVESGALSHRSEPPWRRRSVTLRTASSGGPSRQAPRCCGVGWRGRIRTFDLLIQSQAPYRLATRQWSGGDDSASTSGDWLKRFLGNVERSYASDMHKPEKARSGAEIVHTSAAVWPLRARSSPGTFGGGA